MCPLAPVLSLQLTAEATSLQKLFLHSVHTVAVADRAFNSVHVWQAADPSWKGRATDVISFRNIKWQNL